MIKADSYQKNLLDFIYEKELLKQDQINNNNNNYSNTYLSQSSINGEKFISTRLTSSPRSMNNVSNNDFVFSQKLDIIEILNSQIEFKYESTHLSVIIKKANLLNERVDCIVNAANNYLTLGGGLAGAIADRCGPRVQFECNQFLRINKFQCLNTSDVMHTHCFNLDYAKFIIHAVGPRWGDYTDKNACFIALKEAFLNALMYASEKLGVESIAMPLISSGVFGVPKPTCCHALFRALEEFVQHSKMTRFYKIKKIVLVNIDQETNNALVTFFKESFSKTEQQKNSISTSPDLSNLVIKSRSHENEEHRKEIVINAEKIDSINEKKCVECGDKAGGEAYKIKNCYYCEDCFENTNQSGSEFLNKDFLSKE